MKQILMTALIVTFAALGAAGANAGDGKNVIKIEKPWARASVLKSRPGVAYLTIVNKGKKADRLVAATSPAAGNVTIHISEMSDGVMTMTELHSLIIEPGEQVVLKPGDKHLMLMQLRQSLRKGDVLPIFLEFERGGTVEIEAPILSAGAKGPE